MITSLYPLPGSKRKAKYSVLSPNGQKQICEPFMGGAARSLALQLPASLGEVNRSGREIALTSASTRKTASYIKGYNLARAEFFAGVDIDRLLSYSDCKQPMKLIRAEIPAIANELDARWRQLCDRLFAAVEAGNPMAGLYSFCGRACFGNVMRLNPKGDAYNMSWHVDKLKNAIAFNPNDWCSQLRHQEWDPRVENSWQSAILAVKRPKDCYLLLDPPYIEGEGDRKMTPCYPGHRVTGVGRDDTYFLAVDPLKLALQRGFPLIHLTNYYSARLDGAVTQMAHDAGYLCDRVTIGVCGALGNSSGRFKHGDRRDTRPRPVECLWIFKPFEQLNLFGGF
jgi:hypothetical protein